MIRQQYTALALGALLLIALASCDNREDFFMEVNTPPLLSLVKGTTPLADSAFTDSLKIGNPLTVRYTVQDEESLAVQLAPLQGGVTTSVTAESIIFSGQTEGLSTVSLLVTDSFGATDKFTFTFKVFRNLAPIAAFSTSLVAVSSPYEYEVNASPSYDRDARFNGHIVLYEYTLGNYTFTSTLSKIRYIFGSAGQKQIGVRVKDNSGDWSPLVSRYVVLV